jgi:hypothetical protein
VPRLSEDGILEEEVLTLIAIACDWPRYAVQVARLSRLVLEVLAASPPAQQHGRLEPPSHPPRHRAPTLCLPWLAMSSVSGTDALTKVYFKRASGEGEANGSN